MGNRTTKVRAWELLQAVETQVVKGNTVAAQQAVDQANAYTNLGTADSGNTGVTAWFTAAAGAGNTVNFTAQTVFNGTAPTGAAIVWIFDTSIATSPPTATGVTASYTYPASYTGQHVNVSVAVTAGGLTATYSALIVVPYRVGG